MSRRIRVAGVVLCVIGAGLSAGMAYLLTWVTNAMHPSGGANGSRFTGSPRDATFIYAILGSVLAFGVASLITGAWQVVAGRRNLLLSGIVLVAGLAIVMLAVIFRLNGK